MELRTQVAIAASCVVCGVVLLVLCVLVAIHYRNRRTSKKHDNEGASSSTLPSLAPVPIKAKSRKPPNMPKRSHSASNGISYIPRIPRPSVRHSKSEIYNKAWREIGKDDAARKTTSEPYYLVNYSLGGLNSKNRVYSSNNDYETSNGYYNSNSGGNQSNYVAYLVKSGDYEMTDYRNGGVHSSTTKPMAYKTSDVGYNETKQSSVNYNHKSGGNQATKPNRAYQADENSRRNELIPSSDIERGDTLDSLSYHNHGFILQRMDSRAETRSRHNSQNIDPYSGSETELKRGRNSQYTDPYSGSDTGLKHGRISHYNDPYSGSETELKRGRNSQNFDPYSGSETELKRDFGRSVSQDNYTRASSRSRQRYNSGNDFPY